MAVHHQHHLQEVIRFTQTVIREAPGIEERKIELMDLARSVADKPVNIPDIQIAPFGSALEQQA